MNPGWPRGYGLLMHAAYSVVQVKKKKKILVLFVLSKRLDDSDWNLSSA